MAGISRYEKRIRALTAAFLLFAGGWFLAKQNTSEPYQVTTARSEGAESAAISQTSGAERPDSLLEGEVIDLNTADVYDLGRLPGIGEKRAQAIVAYREANGPFQSVEDLDAVEGIGPAILNGLKDYAAVTSGAE